MSDDPQNAVEEAKRRLEASLALLSKRVQIAAEKAASSDQTSASSAADKEELQALRADLTARDEQIKTLQAEKQALQDQLASAKAAVAEKSELKAQVAKLETQNLALHEQIASHALSSPDGDAELRGALASLRAEKKMLEDRYAALKRDFAALEANSGGSDTSALQARIDDYEKERDDIRQTLDLGIARLEGVLAEGAA